MSRRRQACDLRIAEFDGVAVTENHVGFERPVVTVTEFPGPGQVSFAVHEILVPRADQRHGPGQRLQRFGSADMVVVPVRMQDIPDVPGIEAQLPHPLHNQVQRLRQAGVQQDQPRAGIDQVRGAETRPDIIEIAENPERRNPFPAEIDLIIDFHFASLFIR
ncbi:hypothetical protein SDC9_124565 [bioreactor metagenome]|uniref:Uncharacterized protein n=1 Tax=bioreactor metagenome TaxID=1076179 RepID=A0A645CKV6_9ZZZZ